MKTASNGGVVTSLLAYGLKKGVIDCAVVSGKNPREPFKPVPLVALTVEDLLKGAGSTFVMSNVLQGLKSAAQEFDKERIAVVGLPCQMTAVRKMQKAYFGDLKLGARIALTVGLFCMGTYYYDGLVKTYLEKEKGLELGKISKINISEGRLSVVMDGKETLNTPLKEIEPHLRSNCHLCTYDFSSELADLSVGAVGSPDGWSTVVARTELAKSLLVGAASEGYIEFSSLDPGPEGLGEVVRLSQLKRRRQAKRLAAAGRKYPHI